MVAAERGYPEIVRALLRKGAEVNARDAEGTTALLLAIGGRKIVHLPLKRFGGQLIERLRRFHVLNGKTVRSYAADFIRDS